MIVTRFGMMMCMMDDDDHAQAFVRLREKPLLCVTAMLFRRAESGDAFRPLYFRSNERRIL